MKTLMLMFILAILTVTLPVNGEELNISGGTFDGHSNADDRCINEGYGFSVDYTESMRMRFASIGMGGMLMFSQFETAHRDSSTSPESAQRIENSLDLAVFVRPAVHLSIFSAFVEYGGGYGWNGPDGYSIGVMTGHGVAIKITEEISFHIVKRRYDRNDTGNYRMMYCGVNFNF